MATLITTLLPSLLEKSPAEKALTPWWDRIQDYVKFGLFIVGKFPETKVHLSCNFYNFKSFHFSFNYYPYNSCIRYLTWVYPMYWRVMWTRCRIKTKGLCNKCVLAKEVLYPWVRRCGSYYIVLSTYPSDFSNHHLFQWKGF